MYEHLLCTRIGDLEITLNGIMAVILHYYTECVTSES